MTIEEFLMEEIGRIKKARPHLSKIIFSEALPSAPLKTAFRVTRSGEGKIQRIEINPKGFLKASHTERKDMLERNLWEEDGKQLFFDFAAGS